MNETLVLILGSAVVASIISGLFNLSFQKKQLTDRREADLERFRYQLSDYRYRELIRLNNEWFEQRFQEDINESRDYNRGNHIELVDDVWSRIRFRYKTTRPFLDDELCVSIDKKYYDALHLYGLFLAHTKNGQISDQRIFDQTLNPTSDFIDEYENIVTEQLKRLKKELYKPSEH